jgi:hypothetical protein
MVVVIVILFFPNLINPSRFSPQILMKRLHILLSIILCVEPTYHKQDRIMYTHIYIICVRGLAGYSYFPILALVTQSFCLQNTTSTARDQLN